MCCSVSFPQESAWRLRHGSVAGVNPLTGDYGILRELDFAPAPRTWGK